jgi:hypothetical protein
LIIARVAAAVDPAAAASIGSKRLDGVESLGHFLEAHILYVWLRSERRPSTPRARCAAPRRE